MECQLTKEEREFLVEGLTRDLRKLRGRLSETSDLLPGWNDGNLSVLLLTPMLMRLAGSLEGIVRRCGALVDASEGDADASGATVESTEELRRLQDSTCGLTKTLRSLVRSIERHALIDPLTGMDNKKHFMAEGERLALLLQRHDIPLSVLSFEVDELVRLKTEYGKERCEEIILDTVRTVRGGIRQSDVMTRADRNRFCVIAPDADEARALLMAERMRRIMAGAGLLSEESGSPVTLSIGVAAMVDGGDIAVDFRDAMRRADSARRKARRAGHNQVFRAGNAQNQ